MTIIIFLVIMAVIGIRKKSPLAYWVLSMSAVLLHAVVAILLNGGGTLEDPNEDGFITKMIRHEFNDGPEMSVVAILAVILGWVIPVLIAKSALKRKS